MPFLLLQLWPDGHEALEALARLVEPTDGRFAGYRGVALPGVPFDDRAGKFANDEYSDTEEAVEAITGEQAVLHAAGAHLGGASVTGGTVVVQDQATATRSGTQRIAVLIPCLRTSCATGTPASPSFRIATTCDSVNRDFFIRTSG